MLIKKALVCLTMLTAVSFTVNAKTVTDNHGHKTYETQSKLDHTTDVTDQSGNTVANITTDNDGNKRLTTNDNTVITSSTDSSGVTTYYGNFHKVIGTSRVGTGGKVIFYNSMGYEVSSLQ